MAVDERRRLLSLIHSEENEKLQAQMRKINTLKKLSEATERLHKAVCLRDEYDDAICNVEQVIRKVLPEVGNARTLLKEVLSLDTLVSSCEEDAPEKKKLDVTTRKAKQQEKTPRSVVPEIPVEHQQEIVIPDVVGPATRGRRSNGLQHFCFEY